MIEVRAPFLLLPVILALVGSSLALYHGSLDVVNLALFTAVLVLLHVTVNTLNEYFDHRTGIDSHTRRTMFNGGTGILQEGRLSPRQVLRAAIGCFVLAALLSSYLVAKVGLALVPLVVLGMVFALFYTQLFARNMLGEIAAGLGLGTLPVLGAYMVQIPVLSLDALVLSLVAGILTFNLLLLNEFPDLEADRQGGRRNFVIRLGIRRSAQLYTLLTFSVYGILAVFVGVGMLPPLSLLGLLTIPFAYRAASLSFTDPRRSGTFLQGQKANVQVVLVTQTFVAVGIVASVLLAL